MLPVITTVLLLGIPPASVRRTEVVRPITEAIEVNGTYSSEPTPAAPGLGHRVGSAPAVQADGDDKKGRDPLDQGRVDEIRGVNRENERRLTRFSELVLLPLGACLLLVMMLRRAIW